LQRDQSVLKINPFDAQQNDRRGRHGRWKAQAGEPAPGFDPGVDIKARVTDKVKPGILSRAPSPKRPGEGDTFHFPEIILNLCMPAIIFWSDAASWHPKPPCAH
jgi:hypothetical protein